VRSFSSNVFRVLRGSLVAQAIGFATLPLLSRLYEPSAFGAVQAIVSVVTVLLIVSSLRLELALLSVEDNELPSLIACTFWLCGITSTAALAGVVIWSSGLHYAQTQIGAVAFVLPVMMLLAGWTQLLTYLSLRYRQFDLGAAAKVSQAVGAAGFALTIGVLQPSTVSLALSDLVGRLAQGWALLRGLRYQITFSWRLPPTSVWLQVLRQHYNLWRISLPSALINTAASAYTPVLLLLVFDARVAGVYALVERILMTPVALIAGASSQVFISEFGRSDPASRSDLLRRIVRAHFRIGILPALAATLIAPPLLPPLLGAAWDDAGVFAQVLMPLVLMSFVVGPVNMALTVAGKQPQQFYWDIGRLMAMSGTWAVVILRGYTSIDAIWLHTVVGVACNVGYLILADRALRPPNTARGDK